MSTDAWTICPHCTKDAKKDINALYGTVSMEEFNAASKELTKVLEKENMRLDYEVYIDGDKMIVSAKAYCTECGAEATARSETPVKPKE